MTRQKSLSLMMIVSKFFICNNNAQTTCVSGWALGISCLFFSHFNLQNFSDVIESITDFATK